MTDSPTASNVRDRAVVSSALWAAWGDAVGFQTELIDQRSQVHRRIGVDFADKTYPWRRRVGGRMGAVVDLPAGAYSDDTQLRLSVSRCMRRTGQFDVEAFSKIELPVFLSYGLGVGRGTRAAGQAMARKSARWNANFFDTKTSTYVQGGGNGAAMRVQPHVWASRSAEAEVLLPDVFRDTIVTHGHPRAIVGAAFHALTLGVTLERQRIPNPDSWGDGARLTLLLQELPHRDPATTGHWLAQWESRVETAWDRAVRETVDELESMLAVASKYVHGRGKDFQHAAYLELAHELGGIDPRTRGSGTVASVLSLWLAWHLESEPQDAILTASNALGSDTDTVATMTGALVGAVTDEPLPSELLDAEVIVGEAKRMVAIRDNGSVFDFPHPDTLHWESPKSALDAVGTTGDGGLFLAGLGRAEMVGEPVVAGRPTEQWVWLALEFGQHVLAKMRPNPPETPDSALLHDRELAPLMVGEQLALGDTAVTVHRSNELPSRIEDGVELVASSGFDPELIGRLIVFYAGQSHGSERSGMFAALLATRLNG